METDKDITVHEYVKKNGSKAGNAISLVVPSYNRLDEVFLLIANVAAFSLVNQIVIVDDCSANHAELPAKFLAFLTDLENSPNVHLVCRSVKTNAASCRNLGIKIAVGKYIFLVDSDDAISKSFIERRVSLMAAQRCAFFGAFTVLMPNGMSMKLPVNSYRGGDPETYLFNRGDFRTSTVSFDSSLKQLVNFDEDSTKHQDWILFLRSSRNGLVWHFDCGDGVLIDASKPGRMSSNLNMRATLYFAKKYLLRRSSVRMLAYRQIKAGLRRGQPLTAVRCALNLLLSR